MREGLAWSIVEKSVLIPGVKHCVKMGFSEGHGIRLPVLSSYAGRMC
jgi:hypothetical protein